LENERAINIVTKTAVQLEAARRKAEQAKKAQREQMTTIGVVGVITVLFFGVLVVLINQNRPVITPGKYTEIRQALTPDGLPIIGDPTQKFWIIEFSDFGCPFCLQYKSTVDQIIEKHVKTGNVRFVFAGQPFHQNSDQAMKAALCAEKQGKFWEFHDELFILQSTQGLSGLDLGNSRKVAERLGLDTGKWLNCAASNDTDSAIKNAYELFKKVKAEGTPTMMWSKDSGLTWNFFRGSDQQPLTSGGVPFQLIQLTIEAYQQGRL
jgi:protein-disulfide isomerase